MLSILFLFPQPVLRKMPLIKIEDYSSALFQPAWKKLYHMVVSKLINYLYISKDTLTMNCSEFVMHECKHATVTITTTEKVLKCCFPFVGYG